MHGDLEIPAIGNRLMRVHLLVPTIFCQCRYLLTIEIIGNFGVLEKDTVSPKLRAVTFILLAERIVSAFDITVECRLCYDILG